MFRTGFLSMFSKVFVLTLQLGFDSDRQLRVPALGRVGPQGLKGLQSSLLAARTVRRQSLSHRLRTCFEADEVRGSTLGCSNNS